MGRAVWLIDAYDEPGLSAAADFLPRLPVGTRRIPVDGLGELEPPWPDAIAITGSAASAVAPAGWVAALRGLVRRWLDADVPVLGVCFGHQLLGSVAGSVRRADRAEVGVARVRRTAADPVLDALPDAFDAFVSHEDEVVGVASLAETGLCDVHALRVPGRRAWGVQFHLETGPAEAARILRWRAARHPDDALDPDASIARLPENGPLADALFASFLRAAGIDGERVEHVTGDARAGLREHVVRLKHDLGKYACFQQRWLPDTAAPDELRAALIADLLQTRRGPEGVRDARSVWDEFRPALVGDAPLGGSRVDLSCDPDVMRIDGSLAALEPVLAALARGSDDTHDRSLAREGSARIADACRRLVERARSAG